MSCHLHAYTEQRMWSLEAAGSYRIIICDGTEQRRCSIGAARSSRIIIYEEESTALLSARNNVETCACTLRHESDWRCIGHRPLGGACMYIYIGYSSGQGWVGEVTIAIFAGCGAGAPRRKKWATTLWNPFFVTMLMCHV